jgi:hypothetical protein
MTESPEALQQRVNDLERELAGLRTVAPQPAPPMVSSKMIVLFFVGVTVLSASIALSMVWAAAHSTAAKPVEKSTLNRSDALGQSITQAIHQCPSELESKGEVRVQLRLKVALSGAVSLVEQEISPREDNFVACVRRAATLPRVVGATADEPELRVRYEIIAEPDGMRLVRFGWKPER